MGMSTDQQLTNMTKPGVIWMQTVAAADAQIDGDVTRPIHYRRRVFNPFNPSCSKLLLFKGFSAILV